jgi:hypothetical protein
MKVEIKRGSREELNQLLSLGFYKVFRELLPKNISLEEDLDDTYKLSDSFLIAERDDEIIGYLLGNTNFDCDRCDRNCHNTAYVLAIEVRTDMRGKSIGLLLYNEFLQEASKSKRVALRSWQQSPHNSSYKFWKKNELEDTKFEPGLYDNEDDSIVMCKGLRK